MTENGARSEPRPADDDPAALRRALERAEERLQQAVAERDAFAHAVAHDLKNPLSTLIGYAELLEETGEEVGPAVLDCVRPMVKTARRMVKIVDELVLLASVARQGVDLEEIDTAEVVAEALDRLRPLLDERQAEVVGPGVWPSVLGHAPWVEEVWVEAIGAAVRGSGAPARVKLLAGEPARDGDGVRRTRFGVRLEGRGLDEAALASLLGRASRPAARGEGLGLALVRHIVERLGGKVGAEGAAGEGRSLWFSLLSPGAS